MYILIFANSNNTMTPDLFSFPNTYINIYVKFYPIFCFYFYQCRIFSISLILWCCFKFSNAILRNYSFCGPCFLCFSVKFTSRVLTWHWAFTSKKIFLLEEHICCIFPPKLLCTFPRVLQVNIDLYMQIALNDLWRARLSCSCMIWLLATPSTVSKLDRRQPGRLRKRDKLLWGWWGKGGGRGAESYERKKAWSSINNSILSVYRLIYSEDILHFHTSQVSTDL